MDSPSFQSLSDDDRRDTLEVASSRSGRPAHLLEKDIWVVRTLQTLTEAPFGEHLTFKGGTSLSKAYHAIRRFSEDLDMTFDIRAFAPDLVAGGDDEALPATRSQEGRWTREIRRRLPEWVKEHALLAIDAGLRRAGLAVQLRADGDRIFVNYTPLVAGSGFVKPEVLVEFGARSSGEPREARAIECDAAAEISEVAFPSVRVFVMLAERTFWEKATAVHVFCRQQRQRGGRLSRHWHDLVRLDDAGYGWAALADRSLRYGGCTAQVDVPPAERRQGERDRLRGGGRGGPATRAGRLCVRRVSRRLRQDGERRHAARGCRVVRRPHETVRGPSSEGQWALMLRAISRRRAFRLAQGLSLSAPELTRLPPTARCLARWNLPPRSGGWRAGKDSNPRPSVARTGAHARWNTGAGKREQIAHMARSSHARPTGPDLPQPWFVGDMESHVNRQDL